MARKSRSHPDDGILENAVAVAPNDGTDLPDTGVLVFVGVGGDVSVDTYGGQAAVVFKNVPGGSFLPVRVNRVRSTSTTATSMLYCY